MAYTSSSQTLGGGRVIDCPFPVFAGKNGRPAVTKPKEKTREELQAEIEDGNKKRRSTQLRPGTGCSMNFSGNKKAECPLQDTQIL